ncbi:MAG: zinc-ribbon domain-containing protein, partial [Ktedonobacteraceae bacterium]
MTQKPTQFCTECGAPLAASQRFCTNCGATMEINANDPTAAASNFPQAAGGNMAVPLATSGPTTPNTSPPTVQASTGGDPYLTREQMDLPPPPPPASGAYNPYTSNAPGGPQIYAQNASAPSAEYAPPLAPTPGTYNTVPPYARARKSHGCLIVSIILLLVLAAGIGGVVFLKTRLTTTNNGQANNNTPGTVGTTAPGGSSTGSTPGTVVSSSEQLNLKFVYSSIEVSVVSAQLANSFADDHSSTGQVGVVRLNLHEANNSAGNPDYLESDSLLLVLPDGSNVQLTNSQQPISPNSGVSRDNWMDFAMNSQVRLDQLSLRVGTSSQHQMTVPLKPGANLSKYQNKT